MKIKLVLVVTLIAFSPLAHSSGTQYFCKYITKASEAGAIAGGVLGGVVGSGVGIVTAGVGVPGTIPLLVGGAAIGGWAGKALEKTITNSGRCIKPNAKKLTR